MKLIILLLGCLVFANAKPLHPVQIVYVPKVPFSNVIEHPTEDVETTDKVDTPYKFVDIIHPITDDKSKTEYVEPTLKFVTPTVPVVKNFPVYEITPAVTPILKSTYPLVFFNRYHTQNVDGSYSYGYSGGPLVKTESRNSDGYVKGMFKYVDPEGKIQTQIYTSDPKTGFRVAATNLPKVPVDDVEVITDDDTSVKRVRRELTDTKDTTVKYKTPASTVHLSSDVSPDYLRTVLKTDFPFQYIYHSDPIHYSGYPAKGEMIQFVAPTPYKAYPETVPTYGAYPEGFNFVKPFLTYDPKTPTVINEKGTFSFEY